MFCYFATHCYCSALTVVLNGLLFESASASLGVRDSVRLWVSELAAEAAAASDGGRASDFSTLFAFLLALLLQPDTARFILHLEMSNTVVLHNIPSWYEYSVQVFLKYSCTRWNTYR